MHCSVSCCFHLEMGSGGFRSSHAGLWLSLFKSTLVFCRMDVPGLVWWALMLMGILFPLFCYYKQCCDEYPCTHFFALMVSDLYPLTCKCVHYEITMGNCFPFKNRRRRHRGFYESSQMKGGKEGEREEVRSLYIFRTGSGWKVKNMER